jgi:N-acetylglucosaminyldiphosphoundecaprenol N-acetyl-beta-D-mannosaminyltransferase
LSIEYWRLKSEAIMPLFSVLGVRIRTISCREAIAMLDEIVDRHEQRARSVFFVNAHTLNLAAADPSLRAVLNDGDFVFPDGTGVRWAAKLQGVRVLENLAGTDFVPSLFRATADHGHSYFLLGADDRTIRAAAEYAQRSFPGWRCTGCHHGYLTDDATDAAAVEAINAAKPDVLLVGMGNPLQEQWIHRHLPQLRVAVCMGVGGLFDFWAGNVSRSPRWLRWLGHEWVWRLLQEPHKKAARYLLGNPSFLLRVAAERFHVGRRAHVSH